MDFLVNDLSLDGQFHNFPAFHQAVNRLMEIRQIILKNGSTLYCHRKLAHARVTADAVMQQAVQGLPESRLRAWMQWLTRYGPYWEENRLHDPDSWLEVHGDIVTDSAIGEAAVCRARGLLRDLLSFDPSEWLSTPIDVKWVLGDAVEEHVSVPNHWELRSIEACLAANPLRIDSWSTLDTHMRRVCERLTFASDAFQPLEGHPFVRAAAQRIQALLHILNELKGCFDNKGKRTPEGDRLYAEHFTGDNALFTDSSASEKEEFQGALTFQHPEVPGEILFCTWHGKVNTPKIRIHYSTPIRSDSPLYVVYVGPKITKG